MKFLKLLLLLLLPATVLPQSKPIVEDKGNFGLHVTNDSIILHQYLERENQLLLIGYKSLQLLDLTNFKVLETRPIDLPTANIRHDYELSSWVISPDGRRMLVLGLKDARTKTTTESKQAAWVWDLQTGKRIAVLDRPDKIENGWWSDNGRTLITMDVPFIDPLIRKVNISFWDGETLGYQGSVFINNITWMYLSKDGQRFFAASGQRGNLFGIKYVSDKAGVINVWRTKTGELEKTISVGNDNFSPKTREIEISPDEKFLVFVNKHKSSPAQHRLLAWEINESVRPKYELQPRPKIDDSRIVFSPDGKYFALDVGRNLQIYETETGKLKVELQNVELPSYGWLDNEIIASVDYKSKNFFEMGKKLKAFDAMNGQMLYNHRLAYREVEIMDPNSEFGGSEVVDDTILRPHPTKKIFMTSSDQFVKIFDSRTGDLLQTVVHPLIVIGKNGKPKLAHGNTVLSAAWSKDGKALYVFSANHQSVSLWKLIDD